jgi:hypothetical protein
MASWRVAGHLRHALLSLSLLLRCRSQGTLLPSSGEPKVSNVTPGFKGKSECIEHMRARIKFHTCIDSVYTKTQCKSVKGVL